MQELEYLRPASLSEAVKLVASDPDARLLAGGQTTLPSMRLGLLAPSKLVDLGAVAELRSIRMEGKNLVIGAMTRHAEVASSAEVRAEIPALAELAGGIGDRQVRNLGTIGGSVANSDPAADYPAGVLGLGATVVTNARKIDADNFFTGLFTTSLKTGEIITALSFPVPDQSAYVKFKQPASRFALVGVFVARFGKDVRVAVTGARASVFRVAALEQALARRFAPESCDAVKVPADDLNTDLHASAAYRAHLVPLLARRAVQQALG
jgi:aerobic carbon-monoxide dehydrogenase medium subunit